MSDASSDTDALQEASVKDVSNHNFLQPRQRRFQNSEKRLSVHSDHLATSSATSAVNNEKEYHSASRRTSVSLEEYQSSCAKQDNGRPNSAAFRRNKHTRGHSWSENSFSGSSTFLSQSERMLDMSRTSMLLGVNGQFQSYTDELSPHGQKYVKIKTKIKTHKRFSRVVLAQTLTVDANESRGSLHSSIKSKEEEMDNSKKPFGAVWTCRFSKDGKYMATAGQNCIIHIWKVLRDMEKKDNIDVSEDISSYEPSIKVFHEKPVRTYKGHTADILDLSWSKNNFLVSASMDKTVRLWHVSQTVCLCVFKHLDVVPSVRFHPKDDRFFLSGSLDCKVRLWSIPEKRVAFWNEIPSGNMVTAVSFTLDGRTACVGSNTGDVFFFETQGLKYNTQMLVKTSRQKRGRKVTGIEPMPGMPLGEERILVTTNDSRIWIVNMRDKSFVFKYKGLENSSMQIRAAFSDDGRYIISGSEDGCVYLWCTDQVNYSPFHYLQRLKAAIALGQFGEHMLHTLMQTEEFANEHFGAVTGWLRKGERRMIDLLRSRNEHFVAHPHIVTSTIFAPTKTRQQLAKSGGDIIFDNTPVYTHREPIRESDQDVSAEEAEPSQRRSRTSSISHSHSHSHNNHHPKANSLYDTSSTEKQQKEMEELRRILIRDFEEATPEERDRYHFPDSQIMVSADLRGSIKVWRMDSGFYDKHYPPSSSIHSHHPANTTSVYSDSQSTHTSIVAPPDTVIQSMTDFNTKHAKPQKKGTFSNLFAKFK
ncbi:WD40-repeat-containing domain protein [Mycotypha africana]|uniref:WD40-repeat-containing domain protein n=1 Tax=Mycotypha africana TaxID=64632 RepID=UPI00230074D7|nr:WD40-repeat-containing domain protein [Mycotypha africana]KAI8981944.1 WD40-repeat-containing domain protein [Mycotypha africana]